MGWSVPITNVLRYEKTDKHKSFNDSNTDGSFTVANPRKVDL